MKRSTFALFCLISAGCGGGGGEAPRQSSPPAPFSGPGGSTAHVVTLSQDVVPAVEIPRDAPPAMRELFRVDIYQFTVPLGTLGRNEAFWKRVDEQIVDVGTYDLLLKNGIRVGEAPISELVGIQKYIDGDVDGKRQSVTGMAAREIELETRKDLIEQTIFHLDGQNNLIGRSFDRCTDFINMAFEPTPRKPGSVRVKLCPVVRASRGRLEFSLLNEEREIQFVNPEHLYDLNMRVDIAPDSFLIITPSSDADRTTSVGHAFLTKDSGAERLEQVIIIAARPISSEPIAPGMSLAKPRK